MAFRVSFFFEVRQALLGGWTENFWNGSADLSACITAATNLGNAVFSLKGDGVTYTRIRISDLANFRAIQQIVVNARAEPSTNPDNGDLPDFVDTAALLELRTAGRNVTRQWMRGICDGDVRNNGLWQPRAASITRQNRIFGLLTTTANNWVMRINNPANPKKAISNATNAGVITCTAHGLATGNITRISRVQGTGNWNGVWTVTRVDDNTFTLQAYVPPAGVTVVYIGKGTSTKQDASLAQISTALISRATEHRTGRPSYLLTGRRRTKAR